MRTESYPALWRGALQWLDPDPRPGIAHSASAISAGGVDVTSVKILYLTRQLHFDGLKLAGRSLVRHLSSEHEVRVWAPSSSETTTCSTVTLREHWQPRKTSTTLMSSTWRAAGTDAAAQPERLPLDVATEFVGRGGVLVVADLDRNTADR
jgi:hypothetical protein